MLKNILCAILVLLYVGEYIVSIGGVPTTAYITSPGSIPHIRPKAVQLPSRMRPRAGSIVIPVTPNPLGSTGNLPGVTLKTTPVQSSRSGVHVKTECSGMKIVPVAAGSGGTTKILPKPSFGSTGGQSPVYMMSTTTSSITMVTRTISASCPGSRVVTVNATTLPSSVSSLPGRPVSTTLMSKAASGVGSSRTPTQGKPNVIVVQKGSSGSFPRGVTVSGGRVQNFPATLQEVLNKVVGSKALGVTGSGSSSSPLVTTLSMQKAQQQGLHLPTNAQAGNVVVLDLSHENVGKNMVLADILQASGITSETDADSGVIEKAGEKQGEPSLDSISSTPSLSSDSSHALQTGVYSINPEPASDLVSQGSSVTIVPSSSTGSVDIFSTALASADINLDSFQYVEDGLETITSGTQPGSSIEVTVGEDNNQVQVMGEPLHFLQDSDAIASEPAAVTVEPSHIDTSGMHIEDYSSQKLQGRGTE
ncbi:Uncharacterized protein GBIM_02674 [Gryllus bimaculatus]|nr:Uncharacterized protein GBIM_02674 [Gryllus bimaculatus]